jgi:hypothetical protein
MQEYINKEELVKIVKEHVTSIVGSGTLDILDIYLASNNACFEDMFDNPEQVSKVLDVIFGNGSASIKKEIINIIYVTCKLRVNIDNFDSAIRNIRELIKD